MFELGLSVNIFGLNGEIPVAINPDVMFDGVTGWKKPSFMISGRSSFPWVTFKPGTDPVSQWSINECLSETSKDCKLCES